MSSIQIFQGVDLPKAYWSGTQRTVRPEVTLGRLRPHFARMGITRLAEITGYDRVGLPVVQAVRPLARNLSVKQGKGLTLADAMVSAAMEAAESWHAEDILAPTLLGTHQEVGARGLVPDLSFLVADPQELSCVSTLRWVTGTEVSTGDPAYVPYDCVTMDYSSAPDLMSVQRSSNGLASGNTYPEALASALCEVIERDCLADFELLDPFARDGRRVRRSAVRDCEIGWVAKAVDDAKLWLDVWDITNDIGVPAYSAEIMEWQGDRALFPIPLATGSGCHLNAEIALSRAITEALQARATLISGLRDDIEAQEYSNRPASLAPRISMAMFADRAALGMQHLDHSGSTSNEDVLFLVDALRESGCPLVFAVDLSRKEIGASVVRVVVPGLVGARCKGRQDVATTRRRNRPL